MEIVRTLDLADVVGGGDGTGTGTDQGIDILTGEPTTASIGFVDCPPNVFVTSTNPYVDGVFCPDGGPSEDAVIRISSTGLTISGVPDWEPTILTASSWDHLQNGVNRDVTTSTTAPQIGAHANKGITFDLDALRATLGAGDLLAFRTVAAVGSRAPLPENRVSFLIYVDAALRFELRDVRDGDSAAAVDLPLTDNDRFLTLVTASSGDIQRDWSFWAAPRLVVGE